MKESKTLPILLKDQPILLLGAGHVALQKAQVLSNNHIPFSIIAKASHPDILHYTSDICIKSFKSKDIGKHLIVINATGSKKVTDKLLKYKKKHPLLLNVVDQPKYCDFYFMALTKNAPLQIAVSTRGASPTVAQHFRDKCQAMLTQDVEALLTKLSKQRAKGKIEAKKTKKKLKAFESISKPKAYLVGCGLGDPELLTIKAYKVLISVDVVLYDHLISEEIMALLPKSTKRVFVGKQKGFHSVPQEDINKRIHKHINKGRSVARLKSGDPFIFGRGAEELLYLTKKGIPTEVIPGISSAIAAPLMANIPVTARDYTDSFTVVSAHLKGNAINLKWVPMLKDKSHTVIVLMGLSRIKEIVHTAQSLGIDAHTPCAIISNASRSNQSNIITTLAKLEIAALQSCRPAILVFGNVVTYHSILKESTPQ